MGGWVYMLLMLLPAFGLPVFAVGAVLWLCERGWGKRAGELGSVRPLAVGAVLSLPAVLAVVAMARDHLTR